MWLELTRATSTKQQNRQHSSRTRQCLEKNTYSIRGLGWSGLGFVCFKGHHFCLGEKIIPNGNCSAEVLWVEWLPSWWPARQCHFTIKHYLDCRVDKGRYGNICDNLIASDHVKPAIQQKLNYFILTQCL